MARSSTKRKKRVNGFRLATNQVERLVPSQLISKLAYIHVAAICWRRDGPDEVGADTLQRRGCFVDGVLRARLLDALRAVRQESCRRARAVC